MKQLTKWLVMAMLAFSVLACKEDTPEPTPEERGPNGEKIITGEITANASWSMTTEPKGYLLKGTVYVINGVTLTIAPGTIIKGDFVTKGTMVVERGGKIEAAGTANAPIVFTSGQPKTQRRYGDWGGLVLIGKAPHNRPGATGFEGGNIRGTYGTENVPNDNSGTLRYVRIEYAGINLSNAANSEVNGLTMYNVGSGTTIEYIQVSYCGDDSFEWFGGTVNCKYLVAYRGWDDDFDTDHGHRGAVQFGVSLRDPAIADQSTSNGFESDNFDPGAVANMAANNGLPYTGTNFANMSVFLTAGTSVTNALHGRGMHIRRNTAIKIYNSLLVGHFEGLRMDGTQTFNNYTTTGGDSLATLQGIVLANNITKSVAGAGGVVEGDAVTYFTDVARKNEIVTNANLSTLLLNPNAFRLTAAGPDFRPQTASPLLVAGNVATLPAGVSFLTATPYRGAFDGTTDWMAGWTNFDPNNTDY
jgi:hypothetical protein